MLLSLPCILLIGVCNAFQLASQPSSAHHHHHRHLKTTYRDGTDEHIPPISETKTHLLQQIDALLRDSELESTNLLNAVDKAHENDVSWAKNSPLLFEKTSSSQSNEVPNSIDYESIRVKDHRSHNLQEIPIAIRTRASTPIMHREEIQLLKRATESYWSSKSNESSSRFTYQRKGNSEAHLSDVVNFSKKFGNDLSDLVEDVLIQRVYPWIREAFLSKERDINSEELGMYVYDSLFIRYNATEANIGQSKERNTGAGQPLHRDLGYVSVNVMLNDPSEFEGGGTFFEQQLLSSTQGDNLSPLKPLGSGHALAHFSSDRHAGAATFQGVRDILVIFIAATATKKQPRRAPRWESAARLKSSARSYCQQCFGARSDVAEWMCRMRHLRLAIDMVPDDGEAWHYLGMTLAEHTKNGQVLNLAIACLEEGKKHTPCDARLYNNIALAWENKLKCTSNLSEVDRKYMHRQIKTAYEKAIAINSMCSLVGCDVASDYERNCLNYGLYLSYQDDFLGAVDILEKINANAFQSSENTSPERLRVIEDSRGLLLFCKKQLTNSQ